MSYCSAGRRGVRAWRVIRRKVPALQELFGSRRPPGTVELDPAKGLR